MTIKAQEEHSLLRPERIGREDLYMAIARLFAARSTCQRGQVGCVAVRDNRIICAGYNGAPSGMPHCLDVGCGGGIKVENPDWRPLGRKELIAWSSREIHAYNLQSWKTDFPNGCTRAIHAEQNMVAFAARVGVSLDGCTVFATHGPCLPCAQALVSAGIAHLHYETPYRLPEGLDLVDKAHIPIVRYHGN